MAGIGNHDGRVKSSCRDVFEPESVSSLMELTYEGHAKAPLRMLYSSQSTT